MRSHDDRIRPRPSTALYSYHGAGQRLRSMRSDRGRRRRHTRLSHEDPLHKSASSRHRARAVVPPGSGRSSSPDPATRTVRGGTAGGSDASSRWPDRMRTQMKGGDDCAASRRFEHGVDASSSHGSRTAGLGRSPALVIRRACRRRRHSLGMRADSTFASQWPIDNCDSRASRPRPTSEGVSQGIHHRTFPTSDRTSMSGAGASHRGTLCEQRAEFRNWRIARRS